MYLSLVTLIALTAAVHAVPTSYIKREVPQEHAHEKFNRIVNTNLKLDNPDGFVDAVFALLGNAAAVQGDSTANPIGGDCLQSAIADRAFTNAKAANDVDGMTSALVYRALERNTGSVGLKSNACTTFTPTNQELVGLEQHQDPASEGAAALNKAITLDLATRIASIGGDPQIALQSGTFAPGQIGDPTGAGNTCDDIDDIDDAEGCIFTQNLLVEDATSAEIDAAVASAGGANNGDAAAGNVQNNAQNSATQTVAAPPAPAQATITVTATVCAA